MTFLLKLLDSTTQAAVKQFQLHLAEVTSDLEHVCTSCGLFIPVAEVTRLYRADLIFQKGISSNAFSEEGLDTCRQNGDHFYFCQSYVNDIQKSKPPRFGSINDINTYTCHSYPELLKDLTLVEKVVIARAHPIISIIKLRPSGASVSTSYSRIRGHAVILPQQPGPLLNLLPSNNIQLYDIIRVVWLGKQPPNDNDLQYFGRIKKAKVLKVLLWLKDNNALYKDIVINFDLTDTWKGEFIPAGISSRVLQYDEDIQEREGYVADLETENFENDLYHAMNNAGISESGLLSSCLYTNADDI